MAGGGLEAQIEGMSAEASGRSLSVRAGMGGKNG